MLGRRDPLIVATTDKVAVRPWVAALVGPEILPIRYGVAADLSSLDLDRLPEAVVLKATHGSGMTVVITGQPPSAPTVVWDSRVVIIHGSSHAVDRSALRALTDGWLATDYSLRGGERHYAGIPRQLVAEELLGNPDDPLIEYGFYCVKGAVVYAQVCRGDDLYVPVDRSYRPLTVVGTTGIAPIGELPDEPAYFSRMIDIAEVLAAPFDCVRIDLFHIGDRIIFSEITHTTLAGCTNLDPQFNMVFGAFWRGDRSIPEIFYR